MNTEIYRMKECLKHFALNFICRYLVLYRIIKIKQTKQDTVTYKCNDVIIHQTKPSFTLCESFEITSFGQSQFFDSSFWCALNSLDDNEWVKLSDDVIESIGYKDTVETMDSIRNNMFSFIKPFSRKQRLYVCP